MTGGKDRPESVRSAMAHRHYASPLQLGDGVTTEFALPITVLRSGDLQVYVNGLLQHEAEPGAANEYALRGITAGYAGDSNRIKFTAAPAGGAKVKLIAAGG